LLLSIPFSCDDLFKSFLKLFALEFADEQLQQLLHRLASTIDRINIIITIINLGNIVFKYINYYINFTINFYLIKIDGKFNQNIIEFSLKMTIFNIKNTNYLIFRIKQMIRDFQKEKKKLKDSTKKNHLSKKILFYNGILEKIEESTGDVEHSIFTDEEMFYIKMILFLHHRYSQFRKQYIYLISHLSFVDDESTRDLTGKLITLLLLVLNLDPALYNFFYSKRIQIRRIYSDVESNGSNRSFDDDMDDIQLWIFNIFASVPLLLNFHINWKPKNHQLNCQNCGECSCDNVENRIKDSIITNVLRLSEKQIPSFNGF